MSRNVAVLRAVLLHHDLAVFLKDPASMSCEQSGHSDWVILGEARLERAGWASPYR